MKYFRLSQDHRIPYGVTLKGLDRISGYYEAKKGDLSGLDKQIMLLVNSSPLNYYPDILDSHIFMIKDVLKSVFDLFLPHLRYKKCSLLDKKTKRCDYYYIPVLGIVEKDAGMAQDMHIFRIAEAKETQVAASLAVIEAVLRRRPSGVRCIPIE